MVVFIIPNLNIVRREPSLLVEVKERHVEMKTQNMKINKFLRNCEVEKKENFNHTIEELQQSNR
jgi:ribosomal protein S12 methylthiotransferase accessory factor YcaO